MLRMYATDVCHVMMVNRPLNDMTAIYSYPHYGFFLNMTSLRERQWQMHVVGRGPHYLKIRLYMWLVGLGV